MDAELKVKLDKLVENLKALFADDSKFQQDPEIPTDYYTDSNRVDFPIEGLLITSEGQPNWDNIEYVSKEGNFWIHAGEKDSFGWLTGVIEPVEQDGLKYKQLIYG